MARSRALALVALTVTLALSGPRSALANGRLLVDGSLAPGLTLSYQRVEVTIQNQAVTTKVRQQYTNSTDRVLEGEYLFTVPREASISDFAIWDGKDRVAGVIRSKELAREVYDTIVSARRDPGLLEQVDENLFRAKVFPIPSRSDKKIELEYREMLRMDSGLVAYRFPLGVRGQLQQGIKELVMTVQIVDGGDIRAAWSSTPAVAVHHHDRHQVTVSYEANNVLAQDDFTVFYQVDRPPSGMKLLTERRPGDPGYLMLSVSPPDQGLPRRAKDVVFVVDCSGSMQGTKLSQAKRALKFCLWTLETEDRFNIIRFSTSVDPYATGLVEATNEGLEKTQQWVEDLQALGGTDIDGALATGLAVFPKDGPVRPRYIVFLTDGEPTVGETDPAAILKSVRERNTVSARVFTFGVGEAFNSRLLDQVARENRGEAISVSADEDLEALLPVFFGKLTKPLFENVKVDWGSLKVGSVHPRQLPHFYLGQQVTVVGRYQGAASGAIRVMADVEGKPIRYDCQATLPETATGAPFLPRLWAQREVAFLLGQNAPDTLPPELKQEITRLSTVHVFVTPFTSFIAVPEREKQALPQDLRRRLEGEDEQRAKADTAGSADRALGGFDPNRGAGSIKSSASQPGKAAQPIAPAGEEAAGGPASGLSAQPAAPSPAAAPLESLPATGRARATIPDDHRDRQLLVKNLKNKEVARSVSSGVHTLIEKSENDELTDAEVEQYAKKIQQMLGENKGRAAPAVAPAPAEASTQQKPGAPGWGASREQSRKDVDRADGPRPASTEGRPRGPEAALAASAGAPAMDDSIVSASPPPPADGGSGGGSHESGLVNLTRSYVDKLTRATPDEREKLRAAQKRMSASRPAPTRRERSGLASTVTNPLDEVDFNDRLSAALGWVESLKRSGKDMTRTEQALTRIERLFYVNRMKAAQKLDQVLGFLARAEAGPSAAESGHRPRGLRDEADSPVNDGMDQRWRALRNQVAAVRGQVRLLRARVANLEAAITNPARPSFVPVVERVVVEPTLVRGGEPARISLSIRYPAGARPRVAWRSRDGHLVTWRDAAAVWWAPPVPGTYTIQVSIGSQSGPAVSEEIEVEVYQPGRISYSPAHLDERLSILNICLGQLRDEHSQLKKRLEALQGKAPSSPTPSIAGLETAPPLLTVSTPAEPGLGVQVFADLVSGAAPQVQVTAGSCIATAGSGARWEGVWNREARGDWEVVTAEWRPNAPFHWLSSIALGAERSE